MDASFPPDILTREDRMHYARRMVDGWSRLLSDTSGGSEGAPRTYTHTNTLDNWIEFTKSRSKRSPSEMARLVEDVESFKRKETSINSGNSTKRRKHSGSGETKFINNAQVESDVKKQKTNDDGDFEGSVEEGGLVVVVADNAQSSRGKSTRDAIDLVPFVLTVVEESEEIYIEDNVASSLFGRKVAMTILDFFIYKNLFGQCLSFLFLLCWWIGHTLGLLTFLSVAPHWVAVPAGIMTLPAVIILGYLPLVTPLIKKLFRCFNTWFTLYNFAVLIIAFSLMLKDIRIVYVMTGILVSGFYVTLADSFPAPIRRALTILALGFGFIWMCTLNVGLLLKVATIQEYSVIIGSVHFTASNAASGAISTIAVFFAKVCFGAIMSPDDFTTINSKIKQKRKVQRSKLKNVIRSKTWKLFAKTFVRE
jgi:hypothetical protein